MFSCKGFDFNDNPFHSNYANAIAPLLARTISLGMALDDVKDEWFAIQKEQRKVLPWKFTFIQLYNLRSYSSSYKSWNRLF